MLMMSLEDYKREWVDNAESEVASRLLNAQVEVAEFYGASGMVPVSGSHLMGDMEVLGASGRKLIGDCHASGLRVTVPTTTNAHCVDYRHADDLRQDPELVSSQASLQTVLRGLGILLTDTCTNYQTVYQPRFGEHISWGDTGAVIYANSVLGARSNFESGPAALAAGFTGYTPSYGFHLDAARLGTHVFRVTAPMDDLADWGALGSIVGSSVPGYWNVPVFDIPEVDVAPDALKHLGASLASFGSHAMFHVIRATPEASDLESATGGADLPVTVLDQETIDDVYRHSRAGQDLTDVDVVAFTAPQLSLFEIRQLLALLDGRRVAEGTTLIVTTAPSVRAELERQGLLQQLQDSGAMVLGGVCLYLMALGHMAKAMGWRSIVTNSAKLSNIIGGYRLEAVLVRTQDAVEAAVRGRLNDE